MVPDRLHDSTNIFITLEETHALGECEFAHDIECESLQPDSKITHVACFHEQLVNLLKKDIHCAIHQGLEFHEVAHGVRVGDWSFEHPMLVLVLCGEHHGRDLAIVEGHEGPIEVRLMQLDISNPHRAHVRLEVSTLIHLPLNA